MNPQSTMGSIISLRQVKRIEALVQRPGVGSILIGGRRMTGTSKLDGFNFSKGAFFPPTVITDVLLEDDLWREEAFGPVVVVRRFSVSICNLTLICSLNSSLDFIGRGRGHRAC